MRNTKIKALIFDLDGTIIDTSESLHVSVSEAIATLGYPPITREETKAFVGNGGRILLKRALAKYGDHSEAHLSQLRDIYPDILAKNCTLDNRAYDSMPEVLEILQRDGYRLAVISNKSENRVFDCVLSTYRKDLFDPIHGERDGIPLKPDPMALTSVFDEMCVKPEEVIYFGDSPSDIEAGRGAGCTTCAVTWGYRGKETLEEAAPDYIIDSPEEIFRVICETDEYRFLYTLDGRKMKDREGFYDEIEAAMLGEEMSRTDENVFSFGRNLDAFADILRGGFGKHKYGEQIEILWRNFEEARETLGDEFVMKVISIMCSDRDAYDVILKIEK